MKLRLILDLTVVRATAKKETWTASVMPLDGASFRDPALPHGECSSRDEPCKIAMLGMPMEIHQPLWEESVSVNQLLAAVTASSELRVIHHKLSTTRLSTLIQLRRREACILEWSRTRWPELSSFPKLNSN